MVDSRSNKNEFIYLPQSSQMPPELYDWEPVQQKGFKEKFVEKVMANPFVPIGCGATVIALTLGLVQFNKGQTRNSQLMMRFRVGAQAFTIGAVLLGVALQATKSNKESK
ncbi:HIG1 domain family member 2A, mitochondrial-like [Anneissia japonica]|uniref:HIG1 domain family member 2A, mitochondrial-like n=1 Tax=Anneissia japonica TaxID=1529436 RepID=UPI00142571E9|nr:HIG1 domain family member 2A, mitochondrial-like [Anneissia japonica]